MSYEERIAKESDLTIDRIIDICGESLPGPLRKKPWQNLAHGTDLLSTDEQLSRYMLAYGEMHITKCRAAFQKFPFDKLISNIEIVDWGCGQGLATCVALEVLQERELLDRVKKITLIEPSAAAIARAKLNVAYKVKGSASVKVINKYLPGYTDEFDCVTSFQAECPYVIHLFSNILDIPSVNIEKLSQMLASSGICNFVLCMGPMNPNKWRLEAFAGYFHGATCFSDISSFVYGYTTRTFHPFGCRTLCFEFASSQTKWDGINGLEQSGKVVENEYIDDYTPVTKLFEKNDEFSKPLLKAYEKIYNQLNDTDALLLRPNISADTPDIILYRPHVGIVIFDVQEEALPMDILDLANNEGLPNVKKKNAERQLSDKQKEIISRVNSYANRLIDMHIANLRERVFDNSNLLKIIKKVVIFAENSTNDDIDAFFKGMDFRSRSFTMFLSINNLDNISSRLFINRECKDFTDDLADSFKKLLTSPWHSYKEGRNINLTKNQQRLAVSSKGVRLNIVSCPGSGKTEVLVHRAINANIRTGEPILILTYNLALRNYIKYRLGQVAADFNWNNFVVLNYHEFFNSQAINSNTPVYDLTSYQNPNYFRSDKTKRYAAIFIDEAQDYDSTWLTIIYKYFLKRGGEMVLFEDSSQSLYRNSVNKQAHPINFVQHILRKGASHECRFKNDEIFNLVYKFAVKYNLKIEGTPTLGLYRNEGVIKYAMVNPAKCSAETYGKWVDEAIRKFGLRRDESVVVASTIDLLQAIDLSYRNITHSETVTTFPKSEQYNKMRSEKAAIFAAQEKSLERTKKLHFSMSREGLKLSTIFSFKGWEADNVFLFIQKPEPANAKYDTNTPKPIEEAPMKALCPEVVYTALSRARVNLFIFNLGNAQYDVFFKANVNI